MSKDRWLLLTVVALSMYGVGNVWLVQLSSYKLFACVGQHEFHNYHDVWWRSIWGPVLTPAVMLFAATTAMLWWRPSGVPVWALWSGLALQLALAGGTAIWWGPLMARLEDANGTLLLDRYRLLIATHWVRVAIVTGYGGLALWMLARSRD